MEKVRIKCEVSQTVHWVRYLELGKVQREKGRTFIGQNQNAARQDEERWPSAQCGGPNRLK